MQNRYDYHCGHAIDRCGIARYVWDRQSGLDIDQWVKWALGVVDEAVLRPGIGVDEPL